MKALEFLNQETFKERNSNTKSRKNEQRRHGKRKRWGTKWYRKRDRKKNYLKKRNVGEKERAREGTRDSS